jgi:multimeric flavodoxin WrbA
MKAALKIMPTVCVLAFITTGEVRTFYPPLMAGLGLGLLAGLAPAMLLLRRWGQASMVEWGMTVFVALGALGFALWPGGLGRVIAAAPVAVLYGVLFCMVALPPLLGGPLFTEHFARKTTPEAVWSTDIFKKINRNMTLAWAGLFAACSLSSLLVFVFSPPAGPVPHIVFFAFIPLALLLGLGLPFTKKYPSYYQRKLGIDPAGLTAAEESPSTPPAAAAPSPTARPAAPGPPQEAIMSQQGKIVAINGSPHGGVGNTSLLIEMLRPTLAEGGFDLEVITLHDKEIDYCTGCALCIEKGKCWIPDDHRGIVKKLLDADGIILASPVYFFHVTAMMKNFIDRSLAWGHKPRGTFKPGLAISVAAAFAEVEVADYLARLLRVYGAYSVGTLTAMATAPGGFLGKEAVEQRARDLAGEMVRAIKEKRRYPVTSEELFFYLHIGWLIQGNKDRMMKDDYQHWRDKGFYEGFDKFVDQQWAETPPLGDETRQAWIKQLIAGRKARKAGQTPPAPEPAGAEEAGGGAREAKTCRELLEIMPLGFNPEAAGDLAAVVQFEVSGGEEFVAHLVMKDGACSFHEGPAAQPDLVVKTPAQVWLDISQGRLDGQAAFMAGKYTTQGDIGLLIKFSKLFSR